MITDIILSELYLATREPAGVHYAERAIGGASGLSSRRVRTMLAPLGQALAARRDSTAQDLALRVRTLQRA